MLVLMKRWSEKELRERLCSLLGSLPGGAKGPLSRVCGVEGRRGLKALARFKALLFPTVHARIEAVLRAIESGELVLVDTGKRCKNPAYPVLVWQWREKR
jgi:hypothetical protein